MIGTFNIALRIAALIAAFLILPFLIVAGAKSAWAASLKSDVTLSEDLLRVGDIFEGLSSEAAGKVLGPAPMPGQDMVLNASTLMRVAAALDIDWQPESAGERVTVRRAATIVTPDTIKDAVLTALHDEGVAEPFNVNYSAGVPEIVLPENMPETVELSDLKIDTRRDWFEATLSAPSKENAIETTRVSGSIEHMTSVPVLHRTARNGEIIGAMDIDWIDIRSRDLSQDIALREENLIGMTPRRVIETGKPVRMNDLQAPQVVARGDEITLIFAQGAMTLTAKGKALQPGAKGDAVRVVNLASNRTLQGLVSGEREVTVSQ